MRSRLPARALTSAVFFLLCALVPRTPALAQQADADGPVVDGPVVDGIAAVVGDDVILRSEVEGQVRAIQQQRRQQQGRAPSLGRLWGRVLQSRIDQQVLAEQAKRDTTIKVSDSRVQQVLDRQLQRLSQRAGSRELLEKAYGKSVNELKADFKSQVRDQILAQQIRQRRLGKVRITPTEAREWFAGLPKDSLPTIPASVRLSHIVRYPEATAGAKQQAREVIGAIRDSARAGVPIEDLARRYSDDTGSAPQGGHIQTRLSDLVPSFAAVVSRAPKGKISQVFQTPFGYHVVRVNSRSGNTVDFNHVLIEVDKSTASGDKARAYLSAVRDSIVDQGLPFGPMARRHSEEEGSASQGGRVTDPQTGESTLRLQKLGPSWQSTLDGLDEGDVSRPSEVRLIGPEKKRAFHIVKLEERAPRHRVNLKQDYTRIEKLALQQKKQRVFQRWVQKLRKDVYVDVRTPSRSFSAR